MISGGGGNWWKHSGFAAGWPPSQSTGLATPTFWYFVHPGTLCIARLGVTRRTLKDLNCKQRYHHLCFSYLIVFTLSFMTSSSWNITACFLNYAQWGTLQWSEDCTENSFQDSKTTKNICNLCIEKYWLLFFEYFPRMRPVAFSVPGKPSELGAFSVSAAVPLSIVSSPLFCKFMEHCGCIGFKIAGSELECRICLAEGIFRFCAASFNHHGIAYFS